MVSEYRTVCKGCPALRACSGHTDPMAERDPIESVRRLPPREPEAPKSEPEAPRPDPEPPKSEAPTQEAPAPKPKPARQTPPRRSARATARRQGGVAEVRDVDF